MVAIIIVLELPPRESKARSYGTFAWVRFRVLTLKQTREFGITIRNMAVAIDERRNDVAKNGEREVDVRRFFEPIALRVHDWRDGRLWYPRATYRRAGFRLPFATG